LNENIKLFGANLKSKAEAMQYQLSSLPQMVPISEQIKIDGINNAIQSIKPMFEKQNNIEKCYSLLPKGILTFISSAIISSNDVELINTWLLNKAKKFIKYKLLYRSSRDGFTKAAFQEKVNVLKPTLCLVRTNTDKICGGYSDQDWTPSGGYKSSDNAFFFSLSLKAKYHPKKPALAVCCNGEYLINFGSCGFYIGPGDKVERCSGSSCSNYDVKGTYRDDFLGAGNITAKEFEVFHVEFM